MKLLHVIILLLTLFYCRAQNGLSQEFKETTQCFEWPTAKGIATIREYSKYTITEFKFTYRPSINILQLQDSIIGVVHRFWTNSEWFNTKVEFMDFFKFPKNCHIYIELEDLYKRQQVNEPRVINKMKYYWYIPSLELKIKYNPLYPIMSFSYNKIYDSFYHIEYKQIKETSMRPYDKFLMCINIKKTQIHSIEGICVQYKY